MKNNSVQEVSISIILIVLLVLLVNPLDFWMPNSLHMIMLVMTLVIFALFASFVWREDAKDERESFHKMLAGRFAFLAGCGVLTLGIIIQSYQHTLDNWLVATLVAMILAKIIGLAYSQKKY